MKPNKPNAPAEITQLIAEANQLYDESNKACLRCTKAMRDLLKDKCFIYTDSDGDMVIGEAKEMSDCGVTGRILTLSTPDGLRLLNCFAIYNISPYRMASLKIISKDDFERLYKVAQNIVDDTDRQINEFVGVIDSIQPIIQ